MSRVFIFEPSHLDVEGLNEFGTPITLFDIGIPRRPLRDSRLEGQILDQLLKGSFDKDKDFIAIVGSHFAVTIFVTTIVSTYGQFRALIFDSVEQKYFERSLGHLSEQDQILLEEKYGSLSF